jgi:hypothetical protein
LAPRPQRRPEHSPIGGLPLTPDWAGGIQMAGKQAELDEYKWAMEAGLKQLDWCIQYLLSIQKAKAARTLERNRDFLAKQIDAASTEVE